MNDRNACDEYRRWSRRDLLKTALVGGAAATWPGLLPQVARAGSPGSSRDVLVYLFLRGGLDALSTVVPYGDPDYAPARPQLALAPPGAPDGVLDLDGFFGLNPMAGPLLPLYQAGRLAFVQAAGSTDETRSHFEAFQKVEFGIPGLPLSAASEGWMARHLMHTPAVQPGAPLRCATIQDVMPLSLAGAPQTLPIPAFADFRFPGDPATAAARKATLAALYAGQPAPVGDAAADILGTVDLLAGIDFAGYLPDNAAVYPDTPLGQSLRQTAALIKADLGTEVILLERDGFDHHAEQGPLQGDLAALLDELATALSAFDTDLGSAMGGVTVVAHSEFGRRVAENASLGTDHGHGGLMLLMGGGVLGGQVHGNWPGLEAASLDDGDLAVTTDYRDVLGEVLAQRLQTGDLAAVFPGHTVSFPGFVV